MDIALLLSDGKKADRRALERGREDLKESSMKRIAIVLTCALLVAGSAFAQVPPPALSQSQAPAQVTKATGKLELVQGSIALKSGGKTYIVRNLQRLAGFVDGVKEGATVTVEGYEYPLAYTTDVVLLHVTKLTVGGKEYDLSQAYGRGAGMMGGRRGWNQCGARW